MTKLLWMIPLVVGALIIGLTIFLQPNDFVDCDVRPNDQANCAAADAIVVVSGGDTNARTDAGINLYQTGWAPTIIFSGAAEDKTGPSNAAAMKLRALEAGVPESVIQVEEYSETTKENAQNTRSIIGEQGYERIILVTSGYHQRRASIEFERLASDVTFLNYPVTDDQDWSAWWWLTPRGWWLAGVETVKILVTSIQGSPS